MWMAETNVKIWVKSLSDSNAYMLGIQEFVVVSCTHNNETLKDRK